jgi:hypothetical protein
MLLTISFLLVSSALFGQTVVPIGGLNCSNVGGGSSTTIDIGSAYATVQCLYSQRSDGHGTFHASFEIGTRGASNDYTFQVNFPLGMAVSEIHGGVEFVSWCSQNDGFLLSINGTYPGNTIESLSAFKSTITGPTPPTGLYVGKQSFPLKANFQFPVPISGLFLNNFTDGCSISTFNYTIDGTF